MIIGLESTLPDIILEMTQVHRANHVFYLTGSRRWGTANANSDWDFFAKSCPEVERWLTYSGFLHLPVNQAYDDPLTTSVLVYRKDRIKVDVQMTKDVEVKKIAQKILLKAFPYGWQDKQLARTAWRAAIESVRYLEDAKDKCL